MTFSKGIKVARQLYETEDDYRSAEKILLNYVLELIKQSLTNDIRVHPKGLTGFTIKVSVADDVTKFINLEGSPDYDPEFVDANIYVNIEPREVVE